MSEFLERIQREISERLAVSRAAVREYERLEAALQALEGAVPPVSARGDAQRTPALDAEPAPTRARVATGSVTSNVRGTAKRILIGGRAEAGGRSGAKRRERTAATGGRSAAARGRAPRGANRAAVLGVFDERPGVSASELAAASSVRGGTLYALLRTLAERGEIKRQELPSGHMGYTLAASPTSGAPAPVAGVPGTRTAVEQTPVAVLGTEKGHSEAAPTGRADSARAGTGSVQQRPEGASDGGAAVVEDSRSPGVD